MPNLQYSRSVSARHLLFAIYGTLLLLTLAITVWLLATSGKKIVSDVVRQAAVSSQAAVTDELEHFLAIGEAANRQLTLALSSSRVNIDEPRSLQRLIRDVELVSELGSVSNIYIGLDDGRFYGLSAQPSAWPTLFWMHTESSPRTDGKLAYHSDINSGESGPVVQVYDHYDPRTRPWYVNAINSTGSVWTDVYLNFGTDTPTITRAVRLYDSEARSIGVAGADLFIPHLQRFLSTLTMSANSEVFVLDADGNPVAAWSPAAGEPQRGRPPSIPMDALRFTPIAIQQINAVKDKYRVEPSAIDQGHDEQWLAAYGHGEPGAPAAAAPSLLTQDKVISGTTRVGGKMGFLAVATLDDSNTPPWQVGVFVPQADYLGSVGEQVNRVVPLALLLTLFSLIAIAGFAVLVSRPLERLCASVGLLAEGRFNESVPIPLGREVGALARAFDDMRKRLGASFKVLDTERQRATATLQSIEDGVVVIDQYDNVVLLNKAAERITGHAPRDVINAPIEEVLVARDARSGQRFTSESLHAELASSRRDGIEIVVAPEFGVELQVRLSVTRLEQNDDSQGAVLTLHDRTLARQLRTELAWAASHDALTELINRRELVARITRAIERARDQQMPSALAFFDLVDFSRINNEIGYGGGDELLRQIAIQLKKCAESQLSATVARIGGDEFAVLVEGHDVKSMMSFFEQLRSDLATFQFSWIDRGFTVAISVGALNINQNTLGPAAALHDAGTACLQAKEEGSFQVRRFQVDSDLNSTMELDRIRINNAIIDKRFELVAQKVISLKNDVLPDVELLVRLRSEDGELLPPSTVLPAAERLGMANKLDRHIIQLALSALSDRSLSARGVRSCAINLSGQTLGDPTFLPWILDALARHPVDPKALIFEVTETATVTHMSIAKRLMSALADKGIQFSLDDFGTGLCSFAYLKELPINGLKIDGSFVMGMTSDWRSRTLVRSMVELGKSLELKIVAECIEDEATLEELRAMGVDYAQGFYLHRPEEF